MLNATLASLFVDDKTARSPRPATAVSLHLGDVCVPWEICVRKDWCPRRTTDESNSVHTEASTLANRPPLALPRRLLACALLLLLLTHSGQLVQQLAVLSLHLGDDVALLGEDGLGLRELDRRGRPVRFEPVELLSL